MLVLIQFAISIAAGFSDIDKGTPGICAFSGVVSFIALIIHRIIEIRLRPLKENSSKKTIFAGGDRKLFSIRLMFISVITGFPAVLWPFFSTTRFFANLSSVGQILSLHIVVNLISYIYLAQSILILVRSKGHQKE